jgi:DNA-binding transcriptional regulator YhcF (GntR family)
VAQLELKLLGGRLTPGQRLPSVRALARLLELHANTVSAAYRDLEASGHVELKRGAGVFVRRGAPASLAEARGLDEMIRLALHAAFGKGYSGDEVRTAVERWLRAAPPERVVVVDRSPEMAELVAAELRPSLPVVVSGCGLEQVERQPGCLEGAIALTLPYHAEAVSRLAPGAAVDVIHVEFGRREAQAVRALPAQSLALVVSHSPTVLPFARTLMRSLRGGEVLVETRTLAQRAEWRRLLGAADVVFADVLAAEALRAHAPRRLHEFRVLGEAALGRLRDVLSAVVAPR